MKNVSVRDTGAVGDGRTKDTAAVQAAIDLCGPAGGGRVTLDGGTFLCGRLDLRSGVELHLERDATLQFSGDVSDFPEIETGFWKTEYAPRFNKRCMLYAENCTDIALTGRGTISCSGEQYVLPMTEDMIATHPAQSYIRKPFPNETTEGMDQQQLDHLKFSVKTDPRLTSLAPARVALFMGCRNVTVEGITMTNQPAGWSYWVTGCENVFFTKTTISAAVDMPNNDGIHINCSKNVIVSDCNITTGDDCLVVRAYSAPHGRNIPCEGVCVTNCNLRSHAFAVRVGWIGDGTMRDLAFSNLTITDTTSGIGMRFYGDPNGKRLSDQGFEATRIENVSFSNIVMNRILIRPIFLEIRVPIPFDGIRDVHFSHVYAKSARMPFIAGRADCPIENVTFSDCRFTQMPYEEMGTFFAERFARYANKLEPAVIRNVRGLSLDGTVFDAL